MLTTLQQVEEALVEFQREGYHPPSCIYMSCDMISSFMGCINKLYDMEYNTPYYSEEHIRYLKEWRLEYKGLPIYRIIDKGHIVIQ